MIRSKLQWVVIPLLAFAAMSCMGNYSTTKLVPIEKPDPQQDFQRLRIQFQTMGGELVSSDDDTVTWKDTAMFRMFELKHHTVVVFPYNWEKDSYNIIIFAGRIKPDMDPYDAIQFNFESGPNAHCWNTGIDWNVSDPQISQIHFENLSLGEPVDTAISQQTDFIRHHISDLDQQNSQIGVLAGWKGWLETNRGNLHLGMAYIDGKLAYISINPIRGPRLDGYSIGHPQNPVLAQGIFDISK
jgi:hypothetical protein